MKAFQPIILGLAGLLGTAVIAQAQTETKAAKLEAIVQFGNNKPAKIVLDGTKDNDKFVFTDYSTQQQMAQQYSQCKTFMIQSPADFLIASRLYRAGKIEAAVKRLQAVKTKYKDFACLPGNPATQAALFEVMAQIRLQNWAALKSSLASFPSPATVDEYQKPRLLVAKFLAVEDAQAASQLEEVEALLGKKTTVDKYDLDVYGLLRLAQARGIAANLPAAELEAGELSAESAASATLAADYYCQAAMSMHGANPELVQYCMASAAKILWAMPGVKNYASSLNGATTCTVAQWKKAPANFKDAAALATLASKVFTGKEDAALAEMAQYYVNTNVPAAN